MFDFDPLFSTPLSVPYAGQARMRLVIGGGLANARVRIDPSAVDLIRIDPDCGPAPRLRADGATVRVVWARSFGEWARYALAGARPAPEIVLHPDAEWSLLIHGGASDVRFELAGAKIAGVEIGGGCSEVDLELPAISHATQVRIFGGASQVRVCRPAGIGVSVAITGGACAFQLDDQSFDAIGGRTFLHGRGGGDGPRYDLAVSGGASDLAVL